MLPFLAIYVELKPIMNSIWFSKVYYMFGFLFICYGLMTITCAAIAILMVYFLLCAEDYHWQWRAFFTAGASALYVFLNAFIYWLGKVSMSGLAGHVLYLGYSILISFLFFILTGEYLLSLHPSSLPCPLSWPLSSCPPCLFFISLPPPSQLLLEDIHFTLTHPC